MNLKKIKYSARKVGLITLAATLFNPSLIKSQGLEERLYGKDNYPMHYLEEKLQYEETDNLSDKRSYRELPSLNDNDLGDKESEPNFFERIDLYGGAILFSIISNIPQEVGHVPVHPDDDYPGEATDTIRNIYLNGFQIGSNIWPTPKIRMGYNLLIHLIKKDTMTEYRSYHSPDEEAYSMLRLKPTDNNTLFRHDINLAYKLISKDSGMGKEFNIIPGIGYFWGPSSKLNITQAWHRYNEIEERNDLYFEGEIPPAHNFRIFTDVNLMWDDRYGAQVSFSYFTSNISFYIDGREEKADARYRIDVSVITRPAQWW